MRSMVEAGQGNGRDFSHSKHMLLQSIHGCCMGHRGMVELELS